MSEADSIEPDSSRVDPETGDWRSVQSVTIADIRAVVSGQQPGPSPAERDWDALLAAAEASARRDGMPTSIAGYSVHGVLGQGGYGTVYLARDERLGREVAIKRLQGTRPGLARRFEDEARISAAMEHPSIVPVYQLGDDYLVMPRIIGRDLERLIDDRVRAGEQPDHAHLVEALIQACNAIAFVHERGVVHRDLKAANIVVGDFGQVMVMDWGLATRLEGDCIPDPEAAGTPSVCAGTPACLAPEVVREERTQIGCASDVHALGALLYHGLTGRMPYLQRTLPETLSSAASNTYRPVADIDPDVPTALVDLQVAAMQTSPDARPSVEALRDGLRDWLLRAGNLPRAQDLVSTAQRRLAQRRSGRRDREEVYDAFLDALACYDRADVLVPDWQRLIDERQALVKEFIRVALRYGDIALARMLARNRPLPLPAVPEVGDDESSSGVRVVPFDLGASGSRGRVRSTQRE